MESNNEDTCMEPVVASVDRQSGMGTRLRPYSRLLFYL